MDKEREQTEQAGREQQQGYLKKCVSEGVDCDCKEVCKHNLGMADEQLLEEYRLLDISTAHYNPGRFLNLRAELIRRLGLAPSIQEEARQQIVSLSEERDRWRGKAQRAEHELAEARAQAFKEAAGIVRHNKFLATNEEIAATIDRAASVLSVERRGSKFFEKVSDEELLYRYKMAIENRQNHAMEASEILSRMGWWLGRKDPK